MMQYFKDTTNIGSKYFRRASNVNDINLLESPLMINDYEGGHAHAHKEEKHGHDHEAKAHDHNGGTEEDEEEAKY